MILCGTESWLSGIKPGKPASPDAIKSSEVFPPGYIPYRNDRNISGGGVFVLTREDLISSEITGVFDPSTTELSWTKIKTKAKDLIIGCFYMPHRRAKDLEQLDAALEKINAQGSKNIILCGDFNCPHIDWKTHTVPPGAPQREVQQKLIDIAEKHGLHQVHEHPTRCANLLDLVFSTNPTLLKASTSVPGLSDHDIVISDFCVRPFFSRQPPRKSFLFSKANWEGMKEAADQITKKVTALNEEGADINTLWEVFRDQLTEATERHIPSVLRSGRPRLPWLTNHLRRLTRKKKRLYNQARRTGNWTNFKHIQKECKQQFRQAEANFLKNTIMEGLQNNNNKPFWKYIKSKKQDNIGVAPLKVDGKLHCDSKEKANILVRQFQSVFSKASPPHSSTLKHFPPIMNLLIKKEGVEKLLRNINPTKAAGPDNISNRVLKECSSQLAAGLTTIFQKSVNTGTLPTDWLSANIAPVFKKGDKHVAENYRPVSLTSVTSKLLEHIICSHLMNHLEQHQILTKLNHGFRRGYSCETQLVTTLHDLCENFERNTQIDMAILDFSKAFDTVPHTKLLEKLKSYGIRGPLYQWISNFLTQRRMKVVVEGKASEEVTVDSGVPQGTVLGPILFLCHINDLPNSIRSQVRLFADDCLLYRDIKKPADHIALQDDLRHLENWATEWGMKFNAKKCYILSIRQKSSHFYQLGNHILEQVSAYPYLGVHITDNLSWSAHINRITKKANASLGMLRRNLRSCPETCRKTAYLSLVRSILEYSCTVWDPYLQKEIDQLENVQRRAARYIKRDYQSRHPGCVTEMLQDLNLTSLQERRKHHRLIFLYKIIKGKFPAINPDTYLEPVRNKRKIKPTKQEDQQYGKNIISQFARNNTHCFQVTHPQTKELKYSFFPRTIREWNALSEEVVSAGTVDTFRHLLKED